MEIKVMRERAGLSQADLAERTGIAQPNIAAFETGRRNPNSETMRRVFRATRIRPSAILHRNRADILSLCAAHHVSNVRVFGSVVRAEDTWRSDIDLLVHFEDPRASLLDQVSLIDDLQQLLKTKVDVISDGAANIAELEAVSL